jgi:hypothetical protein
MRVVAERNAGRHAPTWCAGNVRLGRGRALRQVVARAAGGGGEGFDKVQALLAQRRKVITDTHLLGISFHTPTSFVHRTQPPTGTE